MPQNQEGFPLNPSQLFPLKYDSLRSMYRYDKKDPDSALTELQQSLENNNIDPIKRQQMFDNLYDFEVYLDNLNQDHDVISQIKDYFITRKIDPEQQRLKEKPFSKLSFKEVVQRIFGTRDKKLRYYSASKQLIENPDNSLASHQLELKQNAINLLLDPNQPDKCRIPNLFSDNEKLNYRRALLMCYVIPELHDITKYLGDKNAQIARDHEVFGKYLYQKYLKNQRVKIPNHPDFILSQQDADFISTVIGDHENLGANHYPRDTQKVGWISSPSYDQGNSSWEKKAKSIFFLLDGLTGVVNFDTEGNFVLDIKALEKRFVDLYERHVHQIKIVNGQPVENLHKVFDPGWGLNSIQDWILTLDNLHQSLHQKPLPNSFKTQLYQAGFKALENSLNSHFNITELGKKTGIYTETYEIKSGKMEIIYDTQLHFVVDFLSQLDPNKKDLLHQLMNQLNSIPEIGINQAEFIRNQFLQILIQLNNTADNAISPDFTRKLDTLIHRICLPKDFRKLDALMHSPNFQLTMGKIRPAYRELEIGESLPMNISGFTSLQEGVFILAHKYQVNIHIILQRIKNDALPPEDLIMLGIMEKANHNFNTHFTNRFLRPHSDMNLPIIDFSSSDSNRNSLLKDLSWIKDAAFEMDYEFIDQNHRSIQREPNVYLENIIKTNPTAQEIKFEKDMINFLRDQSELTQIASACDDAYKREKLKQWYAKQLTPETWAFDPLFTEDDQKYIGQYIESKNQLPDFTINPSTESQEDIKRWKDLRLVRAKNLSGIHAVIATIQINSINKKQSPYEILDQLCNLTEDDIDTSDPNKTLPLRIAHQLWMTALYWQNRSTRSISMPWDALDQEQRIADLVQIRTSAQKIKEYLNNHSD